MASGGGTAPAGGAVPAGGAAPGPTGNVGPTVFIDQWQHCLHISQQRDDVKQKFSRLPIDEQLAFCAERGNVEPVMGELDKQRKAKMRDISKMTDQIQEYLKAAQKAEDHANTHAAVSRTADDRAKVEEHKKMFDTTIVRVREKCFGDKDLATRLVKPMKYHPTQHTKAPMYFNRYITRPTANDDGYDTKEVEQVIVKLIDGLEQSQMTDWTKEQQIAELKSEASDAASTIAEQDQEIQKVKRARDDFQAQVTDGKKDLHKARTQYDDLESNHKEEIQDWEKKQNEWKEVEQDLTTKLDTANTDLNNANTNLEAAKKDVSRAEKAQETAERKFRQLQEASSEADKNYQRFRESAQKEEQRANELEKQLEAVRESEGSMREQNETLRSEKESLENELPRRLQDREDELNQSWEEEIERRGEQLQEERNRFEQKAQEEATKLRESNDKWSKALTAVITTSITNEDILQDHLKLVLPEPFSSMDDFSMVVDVWYVFADTYTGLASDVSQAPRDDLRMIELLRWIIANKTPDGITNEALDQVVWLETHLLAQIRSYSRSDAWVLLAFNLLRKTVLSSQWPGCCMAAVRLARLANQYPMYDQSKWDNFVTSVIVSYKQLDIDPLGQACLAYLSLTTSDPAATMGQNLPAELAGASFNKEIRIPELVVLLVNSQDVASGTDDGVDIVIVRREHEEVVFSRPSNHTEWNLSVQPITFSSPDAIARRITWGSSPSQTVKLGSRSRLWKYLNRHHGATGVAALNQEMRKHGENILERMRNLGK